MSTVETKEIEKPSAGRPPHFKPEYGDELIRLMGEEGLSLSAAAAAMGFYRQRIYDWMEDRPEFEAQVRHAQGKRLEYLERRLMNTNMPAAQVTAMIFALKTADKNEWREKIDIEHTGKDGGAIETAHTNTARLIIDTSQASLEQLETLKQIAMQRTEEEGP